MFVDGGPIVTLGQRFVFAVMVKIRLDDRSRQGLVYQVVAYNTFWVRSSGRSFFCTLMCYLTTSSCCNSHSGWLDHDK